jgi:hypothetical protein
MSTKATLYLDPQIYRAVKIRAASNDRSISDTVNELLSKALTKEGPVAMPTPSAPFLVQEGPLLVFHGGTWPKDWVFDRDDLYD